MNKNKENKKDNWNLKIRGLIDYLNKYRANYSTYSTEEPTVDIYNIGKNNLNSFSIDLGLFIIWLQFEISKIDDKVNISIYIEYKEKRSKENITDIPWKSYYFPLKTYYSQYEDDVDKVRLEAPKYLKLYDKIIRNFRHLYNAYDKENENKKIKEFLLILLRSSVLN